MSDSSKSETGESPAEVMRRAAELMRERAPETGGDPWAVRDGSGGLPIVVQVPRGVSPAEWVLDIAYAEDRFAAHIASWHPLVAVAVAGLLEEVARQYDAPPCDSPGGVCNGCEFRQDFNDALRLARAYLGEPAP